MKRKSKGMTFVEFLIVFSVLGILASVAVPAFLEYVKHPQQAGGQSSDDDTLTWLLVFIMGSQ